MDKKLPIEINHLYVILVRKGNSKNISSILNLKDSVYCNWELAKEKVRNSKKSDEIGYYAMNIVTNEISGWNYIICKKNGDLKYTMNCCNELSKEYNHLFSFQIDVHSGRYRFLKIENKKISRFFERDSNEVTGEFGQLLREELEIVKEKNEYDYFYAIEVAKKVLRFNELSIKDFTDEVLVGKRYYQDMENHPELYDKSIESNKSSGIENEELPF